MIILGIDPGYAIVGYGVIEYNNNHFKVLDFGAVTTKAHTDFTDRLLHIYSGIRNLVEIYNPQAMAIEKLFFNTNQKTAIDVAQARGVIILAARQHGVPIFEYTPLQVKQSVVGYGRAEKKQVMEMVKRICNLKAVPRPDDAADAIALAICHARSSTSLLNDGGNTLCTTV